MEFNDFETGYEWARRTFQRSITVNQFYNGLAGTMAGHGAEYNRSVGERDYHENGKPYYRVYPAVLPMFAKINLDIPSEYLRLPFSAFCIRLPKDNPLTFGDGRYVRSFLMCEHPVMDRDADRRVYLWMDTNEFERTPGGHAGVISYAQLVLDPGVQIGQSIELLPPAPEADVPMDIIQRVLRLGVSVCFLATGSDKLITPDVLSKDLAAWLEAERRQDSGRQHTIEERARRRGKLGWNVGAREVVHHVSRGESAGIGRELQHQHQRGAHFRRVGDRVTFVRQHTVRPDLPAKS